VRVRGTAWRLQSCASWQDCIELRLESLDRADGRILLWPFDRV
jgi:hypothetical protein